MLFLTALYMLIVDLAGHMNFDQNGLDIDGYYGNNDNGT